MCRILATRHELQVKERQLSYNQSRNVNDKKKIIRKVVSNNRNSPYQASGNNEPQYQTRVPRRHSFPNATFPVETPILRQQSTQSSQKTGPASDAAVQSWRKARMTGCHGFNCSNTPGAAKAKTTTPRSCFYCNEPGHFAHACPKMSGIHSTAQRSTEQNTRVAISKVYLSVPSKEGSVEGGKTPIKVLKRKIGNADAEMHFAYF
ncbi:hypothetical protein CAEBREN_30866 [Caenorhabditis brenneri]|uniref:CCHC-type domain-containing protein n=1 Tax=Caenorhabditis brenneri TaxID=135651 RepID=G0MWA4_CAEBE|nr:hypothetical protein CAEBREN_30866 [Caenorhabditis brenneri]